MKKNALFLLSGAILLLSLFVLRGGKREPVSRSAFLLNTFVSITLYDTGDETILDDAIKLCQEYESMFSRTLETSELYALNHRADGVMTVSLSDDMAALLQKSLYYCELSKGAFDITIEPVSALWDFTSDTAVLPDKAKLERALTQVGYQVLSLDKNSLTFHSPASIDLGATAKGYIADRLKEYLVAAGVKSAIINLGGNVLCIGSRPDKSPFTVGLQKPFADHSETFAVLQVDDQSVVTSGVYERHFVFDGKNYHHILNPKTGYPYDNGLISVTILSDSSADGDALSTVCFSLGLEEGMRLVDSMDGVYACFIDENNQIYYSKGMEAYVKEGG
ncbi:MAG: FAD:protein FMN transferase [Lachnospiraceae bacterium]|nr:FAD:protein FMN transferase [Lachnospiraceae bacterium]